MLNLLLVFLAIGVVSTEILDCPIFSAFKNDESLFSKLNGTFFKIFTAGTSNVADCQNQTFTIGPNNSINGYFQLPDWCLHLNNCDTSNPDYYSCDLTPLRSGLASLPTMQRNDIKLIGETGIDDALCLVYSYCRISEEGLYVLCRKPPRGIFTLLLEVTELLGRLLGSIPSVPILNRVSQYDCKFSYSCPP